MRRTQSGTPDLSGHDQPSGTGWSIAKLAEQVGLTPDTIRFYERERLLPTPTRTSGAHRRYGPDAVDRVQFIQGAQRLGLRLAEIADLLAVRDSGQCPCEPAEGLLQRRITEIDTEIARLAALRDDLAGMLAGIPATDCPDPLPGSWRPRDTSPSDTPAAARP